MKIRIDKHDALWSKLIRARDGRCMAPGCTKTEYLNAHHIFPRSRNATRLLLANGISLCATHHTFSSEWSAHKTNETFKNWCRARMGEEFSELERLSNTYLSKANSIKNFQEYATSLQEPR